MQRVQKIISNYGYCSRREAERLIDDGRVSVNGKLITIGDKAEDGDKIKIDGSLLKPPKQLYLMLNKPKGYMTTLADPSNKKNVSQLIDLGERVYPIGRLDLYSEGLLLMTNDGDFANKVMHPRYELSKTYLAKVYPFVKKELVNLMNTKRIIIDKRPVKLNARYVDKNKIEISLHEGRHKIVKRILKSFDFYVKDLTRTKIGNLGLGNLKSGEWRYLKKSEIDSLVKQNSHGISRPKFSHSKH